MINQNVLVTVDNVVFTIINDKLQVLLIKRWIEPFKDFRAIPGWFVLEDEDLETAAHRELEEETNIKNIYLEQLYTLWTPWRDPRWRVITVAYMAVIARENITIKAWTDANEVKFFPVDKLPKLAFDHKEILNYAYIRLKYKLWYTNVAQYFLPQKFKLSDLQNTYEIVYWQEFDTRNFRKKIEKLDIVEETWEMQVWVKHRPAMLYRFKEKDLIISNVMNWNYNNTK